MLWTALYCTILFYIHVQLWRQTIKSQKNKMFSRRQRKEIVILKYFVIIKKSCIPCQYIKHVLKSCWCTTWTDIKLLNVRRCPDTLPVSLFAGPLLCGVPEAGVFDGILHTFILIRDLIGRILWQWEELRRQTGDQFGFGQPQSLKHPWDRERRISRDVTFWSIITII